MNTSVAEHHKEMGQYLRDCREGLGFKIEDISQQLNIRVNYIKAIESGNFDKLPGSVYTEGYIKNYAQYLKLNPKEILEKYRNSGVANDDVKKEEEEKTFMLPEPYRDGLKPSKNILVIASLCLLAVYLWWSYGQGSSSDQQQIADIEEKEPFIGDALSEDEITVIGVRTGRIKMNEVHDMEALSGMDTDSSYTLPGEADHVKPEDIAELAPAKKKVEKPTKAQINESEILGWKPAVSKPVSPPPTSSASSSSEPQKKTWQKKSQDISNNAND